MSANNGWFQSSRVPSFAQMLKKNLPVRPPAQTVTTPTAPPSESDSLACMASKVTPVTGRPPSPPAEKSELSKTSGRPGRLWGPRGGSELGHCGQPVETPLPPPPRLRLTTSGVSGRVEARLSPVAGRGLDQHHCAPSTYPLARQTPFKCWAEFSVKADRKQPSGKPDTRFRSRNWVFCWVSLTDVAGARGAESPRRPGGRRSSVILPRHLRTDRTGSALCKVA